MLIYNYDDVTGIYTEATEARKDPLSEGNYLIPAYATPEEPPAKGDDEVQVYIDGSWSVIKDYRGMIAYVKDTKEDVTVLKVGDLDPTLTLLNPHDIGDHAKWSPEEDAWVVDEEAKAIYDALKAKEEEASILDKLTVSYGVNVYDANSNARRDMADAIIASETLGITETTWKLADNSEVTVGINELRIVHATAIAEYARIKGIGQ